MASVQDLCLQHFGGHDIREYPASQFNMEKGEMMTTYFYRCRRCWTPGEEIYKQAPKRTRSKPAARPASNSNLTVEA